MCQSSGADSENSTPACILHDSRGGAGAGGRGVACAYKASIRISRGGHGHVCRRGATTAAGERLSRRRAAGRWRWVLLGGPSLRAKRRAAARKIRCDAMRCAAVVSARPGPARQTGERTAGLHPSPMCRPWPWLFYPRVAANLNARARRRGAIRANPRLIDRAWPAGRRVCSRPGVCSALHSIVPTCSRCRAVHRVAPVCCVVACLFHVRGVLRTRDNRTTMDYWISRADMPARRPLSDGDEKKMLN